ncbi:cytochrome c3 family protein [Stieleria sp. JC731]|uniref:cytochrome c3 family protein n=1 Tax=Pirellulaceae TaxID=2691357 RepID=UPI001E4037ED|nr:cytochrome c3 family protein [Stieleria sp. JC731]MCC9600669.1 cytochrome c3 family protein [Stieleria sp. JC731]
MLKAIISKLRSSPNGLKWIACLGINLAIGSYYSAALVAPASSIKSAWLPGKTTHGHYQIELDCDACHSASNSKEGPTSSDVMQDACIRCHGDQLKDVDTHPAKKFNDPTNAELLATLDAQNCLSCHAEHVPHQTLAMGLTMPADYCWHCHQDVGDSRPSHQGMAFDSCATAGCHNYHDNSALYEKFLDDHFGQPDQLDVAVTPSRNTLASLSGDQLPRKGWSKPAIGLDDADFPETTESNPQLLRDWAETAHAAAGVNCSGCHVTQSEAAQNDDSASWSDSVAMETCGQCHDKQVDTFLDGKHGMRLAAGLTPMTPDQARLPMNHDAAHRELDCNACHNDHRFDTQFAATDACLQCHNDDHSLAHVQSPHGQLWRDEVLHKGEQGTGVSCATCHMPRLEGDDGIWVNHDQNANLRPNEKMAREVCLNCHGLEYSLSALADEELIRNGFAGEPSERNKSVEMAHQWFLERAKKRRPRP